MRLKITVEIWDKDKWFVAKCPELDFVSQGASREEAKHNLLEVIRIQFEEMTALGTLEDYLAECGYVRRQNTFIPLEMVGFEKMALQVV